MRSDRCRSEATRAAAQAVRGAAIHLIARPTSLLSAHAGLRAVLLASVWLGAFAVLTPETARAVDGTWQGGVAPLGNEWTQGTNWNSTPPNTVPDNTATFANSAVTTVEDSISAPVSINTIQFLSSAPAYLLRTLVNADFSINGTGIQ